jgi:hypothetical protein
MLMFEVAGPNAAGAVWDLKPEVFGMADAGVEEVLATDVDDMVPTRAGEDPRVDTVPKMNVSY